MKKNILFIIPTLCGGGAEKTVANLSLYLEDKYNVYIAVFKDTKVKYKHGGRIVFLGKNRNAGIFKKMFFFIMAVIKLRQIKKVEQIDYAISFLTPADFMNVLSKRKRCNTILSIRNTDSVLLSNYFLRWMTKFSCKHSDKIVSISKQVKDDLINNFKIDSEKIATIYNPSMRIPFDVDDSKINRDVFGEFTFINVGRLADQKGQWHLVRSFSLVVEKNKNAKLIILGQGPNEKLIRKLISDYHLDHNVSLLGFVDNPYDYMIESDCFVFSSLYEGLGNSILEALACGLPVISTDCVSGPREILDPSSNYADKINNKIDYGEYGILCPVFDGVKRNSDIALTDSERLYAEAMNSIIEDRDKLKHYRKQSSVRSEDFNIEAIVKMWEEVLC